MAKRAWLLVVCAVALATIAFGAWRAPRDVVPAWLALLVVCTLAMGFAGRSLIQSGLSRRAAERAALIGAALLGVACLAPPVSLSDDIERYAWDGHVLASGRDPFASRPEEIVGADPYLDAARLGRLNSPHYYTVYPPLAQLGFAAAAVVERASGLAATRVLRVLFLAGGLLAAWALLGLARRRGVPLGWALVFAWNPVVWWELVAGGHTEAFMLAPLLAAASAGLDDRPIRAGALLGVAACAKLTALLLLPVLAVVLYRRVRWRALWLGGAPLILAFGFAPFASASLWPHVRESLGLFTGEFSFNAPIYYALRDGLGYVAGLTPSVDAQIVPALQVAALGWLLGAALLQSGEARRAFVGLAFAYVGYLALSRVFHPWYVLPALALGVLARSRAIAALSVLLALSYLRYTIGREAPWVLALEFAPFFFLASLELTRRPTSSIPVT